MTWGGFSGRILIADLTQGCVRSEPLDPEAAEKFVGGLGMCLGLAADRIVPGTDPLSPENPIVLGAGPLVGTNLPATSRVYAVSKLPTTGTIGWCGAGGFTFGRHLKAAGFDHVVILGRADKPVYLRIVDGEATLEDATPLWGLSVDRTYDVLCNQPEGQAGIVSIGPAAENLCRFSMAFVDRISTLGRGGFGAVMGAKKLKAIVARGTGGVRVADRKTYRRLAGGLLKSIEEYPYLKEWQRLGMVKSFPGIDPDLYDTLRIRRLACVSCPSGCKDLVRIPDGDFAGFSAWSSSVVNLWNPVIHGMKDYRHSIKLVAELDGHGLDMFEFFGVMEFAKRLGDAGLIPRSELTPAAAVSDYSSMSVWAEKITRREGLGAILAEGFPGMIEAFGPEAAALAPALVKKMHPYTGPGSVLPWDLFGTMELGQVLDPRGPHVGSGGSPTYFAKRPMDVFPKHLKRMGVPDEAIARILPEEGPEGHGLMVGRLLKYSHNWFSMLGCLGICARAQINRFYNARLAAELYQAVTGVPTDLDSLRNRADRVWTLLRLLNVREGLDRDRDETFPSRWFEKSGFKDYLTETPLTEADARRMAEDYYAEWGWDRRTGVPGKDRLRELGLE